MKKLIIPVLALMCIFAFTACGQLAGPIILPSVGEIDSIDVTTFDGSCVSISDPQQIEQILVVLNQAKPTRQQSVQDTPLEEVCGKIDITHNDFISTIFYYPDNGQFYIEQPYQGIYKTDMDPEVLIRE